MTTKTKNIIFMVATVVILFGAYIFFFKGNNKPLPTAGLVKSLPKDVVGGDFIVTLLQMKKIKIDTSIFEPNSSFQNLKDFGAEITDYSELLNRSNPFAPIGVEIINSGGITTTHATGTIITPKR